MTARTRTPARHLRRTAVAGVLASVGLALAGCSGTPSIPIGDGTSISTDGDQAVISDGNGNSLTSGTGELPEGYPVDDVPVVDGEVLAGMRMSEGGEPSFSVSIQVPGTELAGPMAEVTEMLEGAGLTKGGEFVAGEFASLEFDSDTYSVVVSVSPGGEADSIIVSYTVAPPTA